MQKKLLALPDSISFDTALETALAFEAVNFNTKVILEATTSWSTERNSQDINKIQEKPKASLTCFSCGGPHHRQECRFRNAICHIQRACRATNGKSTQAEVPKHTKYKNDPNMSRSYRSTTNTVQQEEHLSDECFSSYSVALLQKKVRSIDVVLQVESKDITM